MDYRKEFGEKLEKDGKIGYNGNLLDAWILFAEFLESKLQEREKLIKEFLNKYPEGV